LARQAATIREAAVRDLRVRKAFEQTMSPTHQPEYDLGIDLSAGPRWTEIGLSEDARWCSTSGAPEVLALASRRR
jgi:hypothetical protein